MNALSTAARVSVRARYVVLLLVALVLARYGYDSSAGAANDWIIFEMGARILVHWHHLPFYAGSPLHLYADNPVIQIGPPALLPIVATQWMSPHTVNVLFVVVMAVLGVGAVWFVERAAVATVQRGSGDVARARAAVLVIGTPVLAAWGYQCGRFHHLDDAMALFFLAVAVWLCATQRSAWLIGLALGLSVATKPWAIVAVPVVFGLARTERAKVFLTFFVTGVAIWGPFIVAAPRTIQALGSYIINPRQGSILWLLGMHGHLQGWLRPAQLTIGVAAASYVALRGRWTAVPLVGLAVRVGFDPYAYGYYGLGPVLAALLWDLTRPSENGVRRLPLWTLWTLVVEFGLHPFAPLSVDAAARLLWVVSVLSVFLFARRLSPAAPVEVAPEPAPSVAVPA